MIAIQRLYPRLEGSQGERSAIELIENRLNAAGVSPRRFDFSESGVGHSFSSCLEVTVPGARKDTLIIAVPVNHATGVSEAEDGSLNIAIALSVVETLAGSIPPITVKVLFLGAEFGDGEPHPMGSRLFLHDFRPDYRAMVVYLNMRRIPRRLSIRGGGQGIVSPYWLIDHCTEALKQADLYFLVRGNENQIFRMGLAEEQTIIGPFLSNDYPAVSFEGVDAVENTGDEKWIGAFLEFFDRFIDGFWQGIPEYWDRHYLFFQARGFSLIVSERAYITAFLAVFVGIVLCSVLFWSRMKKYVRTLFRKIWTLPVMFGMTFGILVLSTIVLESIVRLQDFPSLWSHLPAPFLALKISLTVFLTSLLMPVLKRLPFSRNGSFYSVSALTLFICDVLLLAAVNLSFSYYLLWSLAFCVLFAFSPWRWLKALFFLISPYWVVRTVWELFTIGERQFCEMMLFSVEAGNLLLAALVLPFVLMGIRLSFLVPPLGRNPRVRRTYLAASISGLFSLVMAGGLMLYFPFTEVNPQPITIEATVDDDGTNMVQLSSPAPLGAGDLLRDADRLPFQTTERSFAVSFQNLPEYVVVEQSRRAFLNRETVTLRIESRDQPFLVSLDLISDQDYILFDSNFPFRRHQSGREYEILVGRNPPNPLSIELTLPRGRTYHCVLRTEYLGPLLDVHLTGRAASVERGLTVSKRFTLRT